MACRLPRHLSTWFEALTGTGEWFFTEAMSETWSLQLLELTLYPLEPKDRPGRECTTSSTHQNARLDNITYRLFTLRIYYQYQLAPQRTITNEVYVTTPYFQRILRTYFMLQSLDQLETTCIRPNVHPQICKYQLIWMFLTQAGRLAFLVPAVPLLLDNDAAIALAK